MNGRIAILSTGRQDWGILRGLCERLRDDASLELALILGGMHVSGLFGNTRDLVIAEGFAPAAELHWIPDGEPSCPAREAGSALWTIADALRRLRPEALLLVGDRYETAAAALAATLVGVPLVHLHGGEETEGAIDNAFRHAITKLSHLHLTSHREHAARVIRMGEDPAAVYVVGAPGLDNLHRSDLPDREELEQFLGIDLTPPVVLVTMHPQTLGGDPAGDARAMTSAMSQVAATYVITLPNSDAGSEAVRSTLMAVANHPRCLAVSALGERRYWGMMQIADAMLGNSSSAIIEAPAIGLPAVNIGDRQKGRVRGGNVIDVAADAAAIATGLRRALAPDFRDAAKAVPSPFGNGDASVRIIDVLRKWKAPHPPAKPAVPA